ncbi:MAG: bleomycin hydrolase [Chlamydiales bacterium]|jgi:bleomycin hydrolase
MSLKVEQQNAVSVNPSGTSDSEEVIVSALAREMVDQVVQECAGNVMGGICHRTRYYPQPLTGDRIQQIKDRANLNPFLSRAISQFGVTAITKNPACLKDFLETKYNIDIGKETDQKSSGRCWIFSALNVMKKYVLDDYGKEFAYSQNFIAFWDKMERANFFLEKMVEYHDLPVGDQRVQNTIEHLFTDGGEWELFENVVKKHGVVPGYAMPETEFTGRSGGYMSLLNERLREVGGYLHKKVQDGSATVDELHAIKDKAMVEVYTLLCDYLGNPPEKFPWKNAEGKVVSMTPVEFYEQGKCDLSQKVHLTNLPYVPFGKKIEVEDVGNVVEGLKLRSLNVSMEFLKSAVRESIKNGDPVEIGCEMRYLDRDKDLLSIDNDEVSDLFRFDQRYTLDKGDKLHYKVTAVAHGMVIVGCDDEETVRCDAASMEETPDTYGPLWKVENSWGSKNRHIFMTDKWFDQYCYGVVVDKKYLPERLVSTSESEENVEQLSGWDPFARI